MHEALSAIKLMLRNQKWRATHPALRLYNAITHCQSPRCVHPASTARKRHLQFGFHSQSAVMACEDCAKPAAEERGNFWAGEPSGKEVKMHGIDTYIAEAASSSGKAVLMIPDVYGAAPRLGRTGSSAAVVSSRSHASSAEPSFMAGWNSSHCQQSCMRSDAHAAPLLRLGLPQRAAVQPRRHCCSVGRPQGIRKLSSALHDTFNVIVLVSLAGWDAKNNRLFADKLAASGLTTALPGAVTSRSCRSHRRRRR